MTMPDLGCHFIALFGLKVIVYFVVVQGQLASIEASCPWRFRSWLSFA